MPSPHILVVNDDPVFLALMTDLLEVEGYRATAFRGGVGTFAPIEREVPEMLKPFDMAGLLSLMLETPGVAT